MHVVGVALLSVAPVLAQKSPDVCQVSFWTAKPGAAAAWAEGRKKHMEFHKQQKDAFAWYTWEVINGDRAGSFITGTFDHYWKDFDGREAFDALDAADVAKTSGPATESSSDGYWIHMGDASRNEPGATGPSKYSQLDPLLRPDRRRAALRGRSRNDHGRAQQDQLADLLELVPPGERRRRTALRPLDPAVTASRTSLRPRRVCPGADRVDGRAQGDRAARRRSAAAPSGSTARSSSSGPT